MKYFWNFIFIIIILSCNHTGKKNNETKSEGIPVQNEIACIQNILKRDSEFGKIRNHDSEQVSLSQTIDNYTNSIKALDYSHCPEKFTIAFHKHIEAWLALKKVSDKHPELRGELHVLFSELEKKKDSLAFKSLHAKIFDTWKIVEQFTKE